MSRWLRMAGTSLGVLLLLGPLAGWYLAQPAPAVGELPAAAAQPARRIERAAASSPAVTSAVAPIEVDPASASAATPPAKPARLRIPAIGIDSDVVALGLAPDGSMDIPADVATVGWYEPGVRPGTTGTAVLAGHVDSRSQGRGAFFGLRELGVEDRVTIEHDDGTESTWRVVARRSYPKDELPIADIFTRFGRPRLVLITCGGSFDRESGHYTENVVVYASPVS